ncbi:MAG: hypothetical protein ABIC19_03325 [Patescibacteria group bacterium]
MKFLYRSILRQALKITWRLKFLWFFGIFASLLLSGEEYDILLRNFNTVTNIEDQIRNLKGNFNTNFVADTWQGFASYFNNNIFSTILVILAILLIAAVILFLIMASHAAIINATARFRRGEKVEFLDGFIIGWKKFWSLFRLNLLTQVILYGFLLVPGIPLAIIYVKTGHFVWLGILSLISFLILIPFNIFISFITRYASIYVVLQGEKVWASVKKSLILFRKNWLITLENATLIYIINFFISFFIIGTLIYSELPFTQIGYIIYFFIVLFIGAVLATFQFSVWTELFSYLDEGQGVPKIIRLFKGKSQEQK